MCTAGFKFPYHTCVSGILDHDWFRIQHREASFEWKKQTYQHISGLTNNSFHFFMQRLVRVLEMAVYLSEVGSTGLTAYIIWLFFIYHTAHISVLLWKSTITVQFILSNYFVSHTHSISFYNCQDNLHGKTYDTGLYDVFIHISAQSEEILNSVCGSSYTEYKESGC